MQEIIISKYLGKGKRDCIDIQFPDKKNFNANFRCEDSEIKVIDRPSSDFILIRLYNPVIGHRDRDAVLRGERIRARVVCSIQGLIVFADVIKSFTGREVGKKQKIANNLQRVGN